MLPRLPERGADVFCVGTRRPWRRPRSGWRCPGYGRRLSPLLEILPFQQLARTLALARGGDPDTPRGLKKVTETL